ncbi:MAG: hypothetical protein ACM3VT_10815 [Solirubrobacterales bacterium]
MRILAKTCAVLAVCLVVARGAKAVDPSQPFVIVTIPKTPLDLGDVAGAILRQVGAQVTAHVVANYPYHISASFSGMRHQTKNVEISAEHMSATLNGKPLPIGGGKVPVATQGPTPRGGVDIPLNLQVGVKTVASYPAGRYAGTLVITVTAGH